MSEIGNGGKAAMGGTIGVREEKTMMWRKRHSCWVIYLGSQLHILYMYVHKSIFRLRRQFAYDMLRFCETRY